MPKSHHCYEYPRPALVSDAVIIDEETKKSILLIKRKNDPFEGYWALPGGFMEIDETIEACTRREVEEETGTKILDLKLVGVYSQVDRDPRGRMVSVASKAVISKKDSKVKAGDDADEAKWFSIEELPKLAFDHRQIIHDAIKV